VSSFGTPAISAAPLTTGPEAEPEAAGKLGTQHRLVDKAAGARLLVTHSGVEGRPVAVGGVHEVGDEDMGMELRVAFAARSVLVGSSHETGRRKAGGAPVSPSGKRGMPLQVRRAPG
jgi:hypothetical protein